MATPRDIIIDFVYPPIPVRTFDYFAYFDGDEPNDDGQMVHDYGRTPLDAIVSLLDHEEAWNEIHEKNRKGSMHPSS